MERDKHYRFVPAVAILALALVLGAVGAAVAADFTPGEGFTIWVPDGFTREAANGQASIFRDSTSTYAIYVAALPTLKALQQTMDGILVSTGGDIPDWHLVGSRSLELPSGLENRLVDAAGTMGNGAVIQYTLASFIADGKALLTVTGLTAEDRARFKDIDDRILASVRHAGAKPAK